jgi:predicted DNA-binding WGR domain protein
MSTRRFEYVAGMSSKFWDVCVNGTAVTVRFGRIGTEGQSQTKPLGSDAAAKKHAEKLIGEKARKGYRELQAA